VISHAPVSSTSCGSGRDDADVVDPEHRQVFDLPEIRLVVTEHVVERRRCRRGCSTGSTPPRPASSPCSTAIRSGDGPPWTTLGSSGPCPGWPFTTGGALPPRRRRPRPLQRAPLERTQGGGHRLGPGISDLVSLPVEARYAVQAARASGQNHLDAATLHSLRVRYGRLVARVLAANRLPRSASGRDVRESLPRPRPPRRTTGRRVAIHHRLQRPFRQPPGRAGHPAG
jgi:hypothetical protein